MDDDVRRTHGSDRPSARGPAAPRSAETRRRAAETRRRNRLRLLERIRARTAIEDDAVGVLPSLFVQAALPHREVYLLGDDGRPVVVPTGRLAGDGSPETARALATHYRAVNGAPVEVLRG